MDQDPYYPRYPTSTKSLKKNNSSSSSSSSASTTSSLVNVNFSKDQTTNSYPTQEESFSSSRSLYVPERHQEYTSKHSRHRKSSRSPSRENRYSTPHSDSRSSSSPAFHQRRSDRSSKKKKDTSKPPVLTNIKVLTRPSSSSSSSSSSSATTTSSFSPKLSSTPSDHSNVSSSTFSSSSLSQSQSRLNMSTPSFKQDSYSGIASSLNELHLNKEEEIDYIPGTSSISLIDKTGKLKLNDLKKLLQDQPSSLVIGVIGKPGLGKTFILSQFTEPNKIPPFPISSVDPSLPPKPFSVTAHITSHRFILLDTQLYIPSKHSMSPTTLLRRSKSVALDSMSPSVFSETLNVQLCAFLLSVTDLCFVVLHQEKVSKDLAECLKKAKELVHRMPFVMQESNLIFIRNRVPVSDYSPLQYQSFLDSLPSFSTLPDPLVQLHSLLPSLLSPPSTPPLSMTFTTTTTSSSNNNSNTTDTTNKYTNPIPETNVNHFWLPDFDLDTLHYPCSFQDALNYMKCRVLNLKKKKSTSELEWIKLINQAWEFLKRSEFMIKSKS